MNIMDFRELWIWIWYLTLINCTSNDKLGLYDDNYVSKYNTTSSFQGHFVHLIKVLR